LDVQRCTNTDADTNVHEPHINGDSAADRYAQIRRIVERLKLDKDVERNVEPGRHWTNVEAHMQGTAAHYALRRDGKVHGTRHVDHTPERKGDPKACRDGVPRWWLVCWVELDLSE